MTAAQLEAAVVTSLLLNLFIAWIHLCAWERS